MLVNHKDKEVEFIYQVENSVELTYESLYVTLIIIILIVVMAMFLLCNRGKQTKRQVKKVPDNPDVDSNKVRDYVQSLDSLN